MLAGSSSPEVLAESMAYSFLKHSRTSGVQRAHSRQAKKTGHAVCVACRFLFLLNLTYCTR